MRARPVRSLPWRLAATLAAIQAVSAAGVAWFALASVRSSFASERVAHLRGLNPSLKSRLSGAIIAGETDALQAGVLEFSALTQASILVTDAGGVVLASSDGAPTGLRPEREFPELSGAISRGVAADVRPDPETGVRTAYVAERLRDGEQTVAVVRTSMPVARSERGSRAVLLAIAIGALASIAFSCGLVLSIYVQASSQIGRITHGARLFSRGRLDRRIARPSLRELDSLTDSLNDMAAQLGQRIAQLDAQQADLNAIMFSMSSGVIALDGDERIISLNRAARQMFDTEHDVRGRLLQEIVRNPDIHRLATDALAGRVPAPIELTVSGSPPRQIRASTESLLGADGRVRGLLMLVDDVTRLRRLESMRSDFAANVSHELRTPVTNIKGYAETLLDLEEHDPVQARQFLEVIHRNSERLSAIIEDVLSLTQLEDTGDEERVPLELTPIERIVAAVVAQFGPAADAKDIDLESRVDDGLNALVHPQLMEQALGNLVSNAINYSPPGTPVVIEARSTESGGAVVSVRDQGPGIAQAHLPRIFERFYRVDRSRSREVGGTGLGLAIVKHIAKAHGGTVEVESKQGEGSVFSIHLPPRGSHG